ncbi:MAG: ATP-binding protein, partial [Verrucomicrobia bacterium]|nr:ATP-binding protein [Verrucomicrobiota bacterium]
FCTNSRLLHPDGTPTGVYVWEFQNTVTKQWYECRDSAIRWPDGSMVRLEIATDITNRKQIEAQNLQLQKAESLGRMAGAIAHNFNNQLAAVILNLELLQQELPPRSGSGLDLSAALQSARKAANISTQMLVYLGQTDVQCEPLDLSETCRESLPLLQAAIPKTVVLKTDLPAPGPVIKANDNQIEQVLTNLLTNSWEAGSDGSDAIRLSVKLASAAEIPTSHRFPIGWQPQDPAYACLEVADSGCGISAESIEKIFDPFFTSKFTGRGLGLAVVLGIVRNYGGAITVESEPNRGSVFRVFLPVTAAAAPQKTVPMAPAQKSAERGTVLVIEDELALRTTVTRALQRAGFTVLAAVDGVAGVELFERHRDEILCVLCDLSMPRMDGWETLAALRQLAPGLPFILSSGYDDARVLEGHHPELPQAFLHKPYAIEALINAINQIQPEVPAEKEE